MILKKKNRICLGHWILEFEIYKFDIPRIIFFACLDLEQKGPFLDGN